MALPREVKKFLSTLKKDARDAKKMKIPCERCLAPSDGRCYAQKHWVCFECLQTCCEKPE